MTFFSKIKDAVARWCPCQPSVDVIDLTVYGVHVNFSRKISIPVPHEVSIFVPRLEFTNKITENGKTTETSIILNSLTLVSAPSHEPTGHPAKVIELSPDISQK